MTDPTPLSAGDAGDLLAMLRRVRAAYIARSPQPRRDIDALLARFATAKEPRMLQIVNRSRQTGNVIGSRLRRLTLYVPQVTFDKVSSRAEALQVGNGEIGRRIVQAWADGEPPPIFVGVDERS